jgi:hypothetical protein
VESGLVVKSISLCNSVFSVSLWLLFGTQ